MNPGSKYTRILQPNMNNGTITGGLAHLLQQGLKGYSAYKAQEEAEAKQAEREEGLAAMLTQRLPNSAEVSQLAGDPLSGGGAPVQTTQGDPGRLAKMLLDPQTAQVGSVFLADALKGPEQRKTEHDAAGYLRYLDDGARVFPDAQAPVKAPTSRERKVGGNIITEQWNPSTGQWDQISEAPRELGGGGPFEGTSMDAQAMNILLTGDPNSSQYAAAYAHYGQPRTQVDPKTGGVVTISPDMSHFRPPAGMRQGGTPTGGSVVTQTPGDKASFTEAEGKAAGFADRMAGANQVLDKFGHLGTSAENSVLGAVPFVGNYLVPEEYQQYEQAKRDFINAQLRRESGAAIGPSEFESADKQYFPQPGDGPEVLEQKRIARQRAVEAMVRSAGRSYEAPKAPVKTDDGWSIKRVK